MIESARYGKIGEWPEEGDRSRNLLFRVGRDLINQ